MNDILIVQEPFDAELKLLRERLQFFLDALHPLLKADSIVSLTSPGKLFAMSMDHTNKLKRLSGIWSLLPLLVAKYIARDTNISYVYDVAVAVECFICALDLLDDVEDADQTPVIVELGVSRALNVSTALLALTNHILLSLTQSECSVELSVRLLTAVQKALIEATEGQHRDIMAEQRVAENFMYEESIEIAEGKAGSLMSLACSIGAICVNADDGLIAQFAEMGRLLGIAHQLDNDSHDLYDIMRHEQEGLSTDAVKTDILHHKKTLPVVLASRIASTLQKSLVTDEEREKSYTDALHEGIITTWGISLLYRERAYDQLRQIEMQHPVPHALRLLLDFA